MKIMLVHSRYRSAAPSGENRVVDQEGEALTRHGHEVTRFERHYRGFHVATAPVALAAAAHRRAWRSLVAAYVFISASQRDLLAGLGLAPDRVFVRYNLIPRVSARRAAPEPVVIYAGRLDEAKGLRVLIAAWDDYSGGSGSRSLKLVIAGSGPLSSDVAAWASSRPSVQPPRQVDAARCAELMSRARAVLLPSAWEGTFGLAAMEAMALGVPPVAAAHGSFPELVTDGVDGALFLPNDPAALADVIRDVEARPQRYAAYGESARTTYERRFDADRSVEYLIEIYRYAMDHPI